MVESHYKISISSTNSTMSLINSRLDISNLLSTKKNPRQTPKADAGLFL